jgi:NAD dependent epimerase/dehydratase family enzyme
MSWISLSDIVGAYRHALDSPDLEGAVNATAEPVRNEDFTKAVGAALHRPTFVPVPAFALKAVLGGGAAEELLLTSQRVVPERLVASGFVHVYPEAGGALEALLA